MITLFLIFYWTLTIFIMVIKAQLIKSLILIVLIHLKIPNTTNWSGAIFVSGTVITVWNIYSISISNCKPLRWTPVKCGTESTEGTRIGWPWAQSENYRLQLTFCRQIPICADSSAAVSSTATSSVRASWINDNGVRIANPIIIAHRSRYVCFYGESPFTYKLRSHINDDLAISSIFLKHQST